MNPRPVGGIKPRPIITLGPPSHTVHVLDVIPDDSANDVYLVPPGTTYRLVGIAHGRGKYSLPKLYHIPDGYKTITSDAVATTDSGVTILLAKPPDKTSIRVRISSDPIICLSAHNSKSRVIYDMDRKKIREWCQKVYETSVVPHGMQRPKLNTYLDYCTFVNLWHVSTSTNVDADDHQFVDVLVFEPIPDRQLRVRPGPIP
ncbi:hypothetical protein APHAL10511_004027 [Amanita phalloides]|nr:hypothetical protein APHAL10511_004027 [Amanita phalloides]